MPARDDTSAEERLIARYFRPLATAPGAFGLKTTRPSSRRRRAAIWCSQPTAASPASIFFPTIAAEAIGRKVLRMNLSDLAAKGAQPIGFLMSVALPASIDEPWLAAFVNGLGDDARHYACPLLGGDTDHSPGPLSVSITAFGAVPHGAMVRRATAKPGDSIVVTGTIGDAALGVMLRRDPALVRALATFATGSRRRSRTAICCRNRAPLSPARYCHDASAAMDVSDGLAGDLAKLCRASGVAAEVDVARVPLSEAAHAAVAAQPVLLETVLTGGDDYEILLTLSPDKLPAFRAAAAATGIAVTEIGRVSAGQGARFIRDGKALSFARPSYSHF